MAQVGKFHQRRCVWFVAMEIKMGKVVNFFVYNLTH